ncbi:MAG TPA: hypothetical protein VFW44_21865 [Bryobacteraceae bacterium]|nr:hypothetical protein [Bryobacteraceae bacterium]
MLIYKRTGPVCLYQKAQVHVDMQSVNSTIAIEQMLESADPLIERHRAEPGSYSRAAESLPLPEGCILYSAHYDYGSTHKSWNVELLDTTRPYLQDSLVSAQDDESLDAALLQAGRQIVASRPAHRY